MEMPTERITHGAGPTFSPRRVALHHMHGFYHGLTISGPSVSACPSRPHYTLGLIDVVSFAYSPHRSGLLSYFSPFGEGTELTPQDPCAFKT